MSTSPDSASEVVEEQKERLDEQRRAIVEAARRVDNLLPIANSLDEAAHKIEIDKDIGASQVEMRFHAYFQPEDAAQGIEAMRSRDWESASMSQTHYRVEQEDGSLEKFKGYRLKLRESVEF